MTLRTRLVLMVSVVVGMTVALVTWTISVGARRAFETFDRQRTAALMAEFRAEFVRQGDEVSHRVDQIVASDAFRRTALDIGRRPADAGAFVNEAASLITGRGLDFFDLVLDDGTVVSSAESPARFGYRLTWVAAWPKASSAAALQPIDLRDGTALGLIALRHVAAGPRTLFVAGGRSLDDKFLKSLAVPAGMRVLLYRNVEPEIARQQLIDAFGRTVAAAQLEPLIARVRQSGQEAVETIEWPDGPELVDAIPLMSAGGTVAGILLVGSSGRELASLMSRIRWSGVGFGAAGVALGIGLSFVLASRVTRPVEQLAAAANEIAAGRWDTSTEDVAATGEIATLARAFDTMTRQLTNQRDRLVQAERVAAWRELARRLVHELKNPLFPLRLTVDNLRRAKGMSAADFDEIFDESLTTMGSGLANLNTVIGRFSDFAKMPAPEFGAVSPNRIVDQAVNLFRAQIKAADRDIRVALDLDPSSPVIRADGEQLNRVMQNLLANAIDAMPAGGDLTIRTRLQNGTFRMAVSDTSQGMTPEECSRLFTPYYTTKQHGTGLGLAIVQSVVADHGGKVWVESAPGRGATFHIELPT